MASPRPRPFFGRGRLITGAVVICLLAGGGALAAHAQRERLRELHVTATAMRQSHAKSAGVEAGLAYVIYGRGRTPSAYCSESAQERLGTDPDSRVRGVPSADLAIFVKACLTTEAANASR